MVVRLGELARVGARDPRAGLAVGRRAVVPPRAGPATRATSRRPTRCATASPRRHRGPRPPTAPPGTGRRLASPAPPFARRCRPAPCTRSRHTRPQTPIARRCQPAPPARSARTSHPLTHSPDPRRRRPTVPPAPPASSARTSHPLPKGPDPRLPSPDGANPRRPQGPREPRTHSRKAPTTTPGPVAGPARHRLARHRQVSVTWPTSAPVQGNLRELRRSWPSQRRRAPGGVPYSSGQVSVSCPIRCLATGTFGELPRAWVGLAPGIAPPGPPVPTRRRSRPAPRRGKSP